MLSCARSLGGSRASSREGEAGGTSPRERDMRAAPGPVCLHEASPHTRRSSNGMSPGDVVTSRTPPPPYHRAGDHHGTQHGDKVSPAATRNFSTSRSPHSPRAGTPDGGADAGHEQQQHQQAAPDGPPGGDGPTAPALPRPRVPPGVHSAYAISSLLGAGAFGTVWMATARESGSRVAIKIVERKRQLQEDFSLMPTEVEILKRIHHPNSAHQHSRLQSSHVCGLLGHIWRLTWENTAHCSQRSLYQCVPQLLS